MGLVTRVDSVNPEKGVESGDHVSFPDPLDVRNPEKGVESSRRRCSQRWAPLWNPEKGVERKEAEVERAVVSLRIPKRELKVTLGLDDLRRPLLPESRKGS